MSLDPARVLVVDDQPAVQADFGKILAPPLDGGQEGLARGEELLFGERAPREPAGPRFELEFASSGAEALERVRASCRVGRPFAVAFVDMLMPGGWDGVETVQALWREDPELQVVICTAYRESTWEDVRRRLAPSDCLLLLQKPFDRFEVLQLASALSHKARLERRARREREELERLVAERTAELSAANRALVEQMLECRRAESEARSAAESLSAAHEELEAMHAQAQVATLARNEFLSNMSHEIRTPMSAILGYADLLRDPALSEETRAEHLEVIGRNGRHLLSLLGDILDLSTLESGRLRVERVACSPAALLDDLASRLRPLCSEKGLALRLRAEGPLPASVRTDPARLRKLLEHLIGNAIRFTGEGDVRVVLRLESPADARGPWLAIDVEDSGVGLDPERAEELFQPFRQADGSPTRRHGGAGLGLSLARGLARRLGGDVVVSRSSGGGSCFTATVATGSLAGVPLLATLEQALAAAAQQDSEGSADLERALTGLRILLAEDGRDNQLLLALYLRKAGAEVSLASDGSRALHMAVLALSKGQPYHVIVTDMHMPGIDGYELARRLRRDGYLSPILALTAQALDGDRERCLAAGCDDYLSKPVDRLRLVATCARLAARGAGLGHTSFHPASVLAHLRSAPAKAPLPALPKRDPAPESSLDAIPEERAG